MLEPVGFIFAHAVLSAGLLLLLILWLTCARSSVAADLNEQHLERYSSSEAMQSDEYSSAMLRHTILRAAPYATSKQLRERRLRSLLPDEQGGAQPMPPLTSPEQLARAAVQDALYTRPNTLKRRVTREVMCPL